MSYRRPCLIVLAAALIAFLPVVPAAAAEDKDSDGDGLTDVQEKLLGTLPDKPEVFTTLVDHGPLPESRRRPNYDATKDILTFEYCHVGQARHMWRVTLVEPFRSRDSVLHLYVDADADRKTGRQDVGNEYMVTIDGGKARTNVYTPEGKLSYASPPRVVITGNAVILSADVKLSRNDKGFLYSIRTVCHTRTMKPKEPVKMTDIVDWFLVEGFPVRPETVPQLSPK